MTVKCRGHLRTAEAIGISKTRRKIYGQPTIVFLKNCEWCRSKQ